MEKKVLLKDKFNIKKILNRLKLLISNSFDTSEGMIKMQYELAITDENGQIQDPQLITVYYNNKTGKIEVYLIVMEIYKIPIGIHKLVPIVSYKSIEDIFVNKYEFELDNKIDRDNLHNDLSYIYIDIYEKDMRDVCKQIKYINTQVRKIINEVKKKLYMLLKDAINRKIWKLPIHETTCLYYNPYRYNNIKYQINNFPKNTLIHSEDFNDAIDMGKHKTIVLKRTIIVNHDHIIPSIILYYAIQINDNDTQSLSINGFYENQKIKLEGDKEKFASNIRKHIFKFVSYKHTIDLLNMTSKFNIDDINKGNIRPYENRIEIKIHNDDDIVLKQIKYIEKNIKQYLKKMINKFIALDKKGSEHPILKKLPSITEIDIHIKH